MKKVKLIIPSIPKDMGILLANIELFYLNLPIDKIIIIGPHELENLLTPLPQIEFLCEDIIIDKDRIKDIIKCIAPDSYNNIRLGWYIQQFIKMTYSLRCKDEFYLLWDSDTVPLKKVKLFNEKGKPIFHTKTEFHKPYFDTIERLIPGLKKQIKGSFIAEHMLIKTDYMQSLIKDIESNNNVKGDTFEEKILNAVEIKELCKNGFSEFETYGTYVQHAYPDAYCYENWTSLRYGGFFFSGIGLRNTDVNWLCKNYDAISFEKKHKLSSLNKITKSLIYQKVFSANTLDYLSLIFRLKTRLIK